MSMGLVIPVREVLLCAVVTLALIRAAPVHDTWEEQTATGRRRRATVRAPAPSVTIKGLGQVLGTQEISGINAFYAIPYAKAPIGDLRWKPPVAPDPWSEPLEGFSYGPACAQGGFPTHSESFPTQSEDCLHINVAAPVGAQGLPVMLWIHGGGNNEEASYEPWFNLSTLVKTSGMRVVVASIEYRVNAFGFLGSSELAASIPTGEYAGSTGNYGLMDQRFAMKWVNQYIAAFGGDPNQVTIFGESAGAYDVGLHLVQPGSFPYYKRAIIESYGNSQIEHITMEFAQGVYDKLLTGASCSDLACLRNKTTAEIVAALGAFSPSTPTQSAGKWNPVIDGVYTVATGWDLILQGYFNKNAQVLLGANHDEASILSASLDRVTGVLSPTATEKDFETFLDTIQVTPSLNSAQKAHVKELYAWDTYDDYPAFTGALPSGQTSFGYINGGQNLSKWWWAATMAAEDAATPHTTGYCTERRMARHLSKEIDTYLYIFAHPPQYKEFNNSLPGYMFGPEMPLSPHGSEMRYVFNAMDEQTANVTAMDRAVALATASSWAAFAATGDPSSSAFASAFKGWEKYSGSEDKTYYISPSLDKFEGGLMRKVRAKQCDYWATLKTQATHLITW